MRRHSTRVTIDISWSALLKVVLLVVGIWAMVVLRDVFVLLFLVFTFVGAVDPSVRRLQERLPRAVAVTVVYVVIVGCVILLTYLIQRPLYDQVNELGNTLPATIEQARPFITNLRSDQYASVFDNALSTLSNTVAAWPANFFNLTMSFFGGLATVLTGLVLSFYLLLEERNAKDFFHQVLPHDRYESIYTTVNKISQRLGSWVRGQLVLMAIIFLANFLLYLIVGIPSPLPLGLWAGLCEVIPYIGPLIGILPAVLVAFFSGSLLQALIVVLVGIFVIQQLEAHLIVPKVMGKAVGLSPVLVIIALIAGTKLYGLLGGVLALPVAAAVSVIIGEWPQLRKTWEAAATSEE